VEKSKRSGKIKTKWKNQNEVGKSKRSGKIKTKWKNQNEVEKNKSIMPLRIPT
jgi:hypothetical protein